MGGARPHLKLRSANEISEINVMEASSIEPPLWCPDHTAVYYSRNLAVHVYGLIYEVDAWPLAVMYATEPAAC